MIRDTITFAAVFIVVAMLLVYVGGTLGCWGLPAVAGLVIGVVLVWILESGRNG